MNKDSGSEIADEGKSSGESNPESRRVPVTEPDAEVYEFVIDGVIEVSASFTITKRKIQ